MPATSFQVILDEALTDYCEQIGVDLDNHPFADDLRGYDSPDDILKILEDKANAFKVYRDGNRKLIDCLKPVVRVMHTLSGVLGDSVSLVSQMLWLFVFTFFTARRSGAIQTSKGDLCRRGCSDLRAYPLTFPHIHISISANATRQPMVLAQATIYLLTYLNVSGTSSNAFGFIPMSR
jgi:hypothetical protein